MIRLDGRVIIVTGAAGNLGRAVAERCRRAGARTVLVDRGNGRLPKHFADLLGSNDHLLLSGIDLTDGDAAQAMVARVLDRFGRIDGLVHTVGGFRAGTWADGNAPDDLDFLLDANLRTVMITCGAVVPEMIRRGFGRVVTVGAMAALAVPPPGLVAYAAAKAALLRYTEGLAQDVRRHGVNANAILPAIMDTPENHAAMPDADVSAWVTPDAIADVVLFLLSDLARAVTGAAIAVPGVGSR